MARFGPYVQLDKLFASLTKEDDPYTVTLERGNRTHRDQARKERNKYIKVFTDEIAILNGRWGPYIKYGKENVKIPKDIEEPKNLELEDIQKLYEEHLKKPKKPKRAKKK